MKDISKTLSLSNLLKLLIIYQEILMAANQMLSTYTVVFQETNLISDLSTNRWEQLWDDGPPLHHVYSDLVLVHHLAETLTHHLKTADMVWTTQSRDNLLTFI